MANNFPTYRAIRKRAFNPRRSVAGKHIRFSSLIAPFSFLLNDATVYDAWIFNPSYCFTDAAGLTPVTTAGDLVQVCRSLRNVNSLVQGTGAKRPTMDFTSGIWGAKGNVSNAVEMKVVFSAPISQPLTIYTIERNPAPVTPDAYVYDDSSAGTNRCVGAYGDSAGANPGKYQMYAGTALLAGSVPAGGFVANCIVYNGASSFHYPGSTQTSPGNPGAQGLDGLTVFNRFAVTNYFPDVVRGLIIFSAAHSLTTVQTKIATFRPLFGAV